MTNFHKFWGVKMRYDHDFHDVQVHDGLYEGLLTLAQNGTVNWRMAIYPTIEESKMWNCCKVM